MTNWTFSEESISAVAGEIAAKLASHRQGFVLHLVGTLGAGKTTLTRAILRALGLPEDEVVLSPTFTYFNEYEINGRWYAHVDLYRAREGMRLEDIGLADARPYHGLFIEWPDQLGKQPLINPTHIIHIEMVERDANLRMAMLSQLVEESGR